MESSITMSTNTAKVHFIVDEFMEDYKEEFGESEAVSDVWKRWRNILSFLLRSVTCEYPLYLYCFCINPFGCLKNIQAVILNWCGIVAAIALIASECRTPMLKIFRDYDHVFVFLGVVCLWTAMLLAKRTTGINAIAQDIDDVVSNVLQTEIMVDKTLNALRLSNLSLKDGLVDLQDKNIMMRRVGRKLKVRNYQAKEQENKVRELLVRNSDQGSDLKSKRIAIDDLIKEQHEVLDQMKDSIALDQEDWAEFDKRAARYKKGIERLSATVGEISKPISNLEAMKPKLKDVATREQFRSFHNFHLQYLSILEHTTLLKEFWYCRTIFSNAIKSNGGFIDLPLFMGLIRRLPHSIQMSFKNSSLSFQNYRSVLGRGRLSVLGRGYKYGSMSEVRANKFLSDLESQAFRDLQIKLIGMRAPSYFTYEAMPNLQDRTIFNLSSPASTSLKEVENYFEEKVHVVT